jgi:hypothetical protein
MDRLSNNQLVNDYDPCRNLIHEYIRKLGLLSFLHINLAFYYMVEYLQT